MKKVLLVITVLFIICGCSGCSKKVVYESNYGIRYDYDKTHVTIRTDFNKSGEVLDLIITNETSETKLTDAAGINSDLSKEDDVPVTYYAEQKDDGTVFERIVIHLYKEDFDPKTAEGLFEYLGLTEEFKDKVIYYSDELLKAEDFRYQRTIREGTATTNISFDGDRKYEFTN